MNNNKSEYEIVARKQLENQGLINPKHMQTLSVFETRRDKALRHILEKEREIEEKKRMIEKQDFDRELQIARKALAEK